MFGAIARDHFGGVVDSEEQREPLTGFPQTSHSLSPTAAAASTATAAKTAATAAATAAKLAAVADVSLASTASGEVSDPTAFSSRGAVAACP